MLCTGANFTGIAGPHLAATGALASAPEADGAGLRRVRLQMLQTQPFPGRLTTSVADGDSLRYYPAYDVPSLASLPPQAEVAARNRAQLLLVQRLDGSLTIGDTHEYDEPFGFDVDEGAYDHLVARAAALLGGAAAAGAAALGRRLQRGGRRRDDLPPFGRHARRGPGDRPRRARHDLFTRDRRGDLPVSRFTVVCLDMAGTTVRDGNAVMAAFAAAIGSRNLPGDEFNGAMKYARDTMGQSKIEVFRHILGDEDAAQAANAAFEKHYAGAVAAGEISPMPGAVELFAACRAAGTRVCLSTGFAPVTRDAIIDALGWGSLVDLFLSPADAGRGRPWPDMPLTALLRLGGDAVSSLVVAGRHPGRRRVRPARGRRPGGRRAVRRLRPAPTWRPSPPRPACPAPR